VKKSNNSKILITGVAGYIGSHVLACLLENGYIKSQIYGIDNFSTGIRNALLDAIDFQILDLTDFEKTKKTVNEINPDIVIHLAGNRFARKSITNPFDVYSGNTISTINLSEALRLSTKSCTIIFSSSCSVYGDKNTVVREEDTFEPISPYGRSKVMCESILEDSFLAGGATPIILRYFNAAGVFPPGVPDRAREGLIANLVHHANFGSNIPVFGTDLPTKDGTCIRDYISVGDIARAHLSIVRRIERGGPFRSSTYNLGTGIGTSVLDIIDIFNKVFNKSVQITKHDASGGDPVNITADSRKFAEEFKWAPKDDISVIINSLHPLVQDLI
jgi:UDP-glucose 4-epimerase